MNLPMIKLKQAEQPKREPVAISGTNKAKIIELCFAHGVSYWDITGKSRKSKITKIRQQIITELHSTHGVRLASLARAFNRDHSTIIYALTKTGYRNRKTHTRKPSATGVVGVYMYKNKFRASITYKQVKYHGGDYDKLSDAAVALREMKARIGIDV